MKKNGAPEKSLFQSELERMAWALGGMLLKGHLGPRRSRGLIGKWLKQLGGEHACLIDFMDRVKDSDKPVAAMEALLRENCQPTDEEFTADVAKLSAEWDRAHGG